MHPHQSKSLSALDFLLTGVLLLPFTVLKDHEVEWRIMKDQWGGTLKSYGKLVLLPLWQES